MARRPDPSEMLRTGMILDQARIEREAKAGNWSDRLLTDYLDDILKNKPDSPALITYRTDTGAEATISYSELNDQVDRIAGNLAGLGVAKGQVVSFQLPNWWQFVAVHLACLRIGAISNPLMPIFRARELEYMVGFAESRVLILPKFFQKYDYEAMGEKLLETIPTLRHVIIVDGEGEYSFEKTLLRKPIIPAAEISPLSPNDVVQLLFTSGTTGQPKGVMHTSNTLLASSRQVAERMELDASDIGFMPAPFAHQIGFCFGMTTAIYLGIPLVILDVWNAQTAVDLISRYRATYSCASTPFMADLAAVPDVENRDLDSFRVFLTAGAPIMEPVVERITRKLKVDVVPGWGMTEVIQATATQPLTLPSAPLSDGAALKGNQVRVVDRAGKELASGQDGCLQCRGATLFVGYYKKPELYAVDKDGWFDTEDLARMDDNGNIRIIGRDKDIIIRGGENVPVLEVESLLCKMPEVEDVALVSMPDERLGERGCMFVTLKPEARLGFNDMVAYLKEQNLAQQYFPERLEILRQMPRTPSGKIQKFILREWATQIVEKGYLVPTIPAAKKHAR